MISPENTYSYSIGTSGLNYSSNENMLSSSVLIGDSCNVNLHDTFIKVRGGTELFLEIENVEISGLFYFDIKRTTGLLLTTFNGKIFKDKICLKTGLGLNRFSNFVRWNDSVIICNQVNLPQVWDGESTTTSDLEFPEAGWSSNQYPMQSVVHGKGNSERLWTIGAGHSPKLIYYSKTNDGLSEPDFTGDDAGFIYLETGDDVGLTGIIEFGDRLIAFSNESSFLVLDNDYDPANWGYTQAQWKGGCASWRLIARLENDILCMMKDGTVYSISAVQQYGDYISSSITEPASIDTFFNKKFDLSQINKFHCIYDPFLRAIKFFGVAKYNEKVNQALVYFVDKTPSTGWAFHIGSGHVEKEHESRFDETNFDIDSFDITFEREVIKSSSIFDVDKVNIDPPDGEEDILVVESGYNASCSSIVPTLKNQYKIFTGDYSGRVWELETSRMKDRQSSFDVVLNPAPLFFGDQRSLKRFKRGYIEIKATNTFKIEISFFKDNLFIKSVTIMSKSSGDVYGEAIYGKSRYATLQWETIRYPINLIGRGLTQKIKHSQEENASRYGEAIYGKDVYTYLSAGKPFLLGRNFIDLNILGHRI